MTLCDFLNAPSGTNILSCLSAIPRDSRPGWISLVVPISPVSDARVMLSGDFRIERTGTDF